MLVDIIRNIKDHPNKKLLTLRCNFCHEKFEKNFSNRLLEQNKHYCSHNCFHKSGGSIKRYSCDENFFSKSNEQSFYWAGFLAADGCVRKASSNSRLLVLSVAKKDLQHIKLFKKQIKSKSPIIITVYDNTIACRIAITSNTIFDDLAKFNIVPRKTLKYTFPKWLT